VGHHRCRTPVRVWGLPRSIGPAGLIAAAAGDLLAFARLHLDRGITTEGKRLVTEASAATRSPCAAIPDFSSPGAAIGLGWRVSRWGDRTVIGHDGDTVGQSAYLRVDPEAGVAACLLTNCAESEPLYRELFGEVFGALTGVRMPAPLRPADAVPGPGRGGGKQHGWTIDAAGAASMVHRCRVPGGCQPGSGPTGRAWRGG
jgi:CubicO group peptidase (beta-lactamase class C family)